MAIEDVRTIIPLPRSSMSLPLLHLAQTWLLHMPTDYYVPVALRTLKPEIFQRLLLDPQAGMRLDHGAAVKVGDEWFYQYRLTFGLLSRSPAAKSLHVSLTAFYSDPPMCLSELEAALRLLSMAGSAEGSAGVAAGFVRKDDVWGWRIMFTADTGQEAGSFPLASYARRQHGELAVWERLRRVGGPVVEE